MGFPQRCHRVMLPWNTNPATTTKITSRDAKASPSRAFASLALSETWMPRWAERALTAGTAAEACAVARMSLADFADARDRDPVFGDLCRMLDMIADLRITEKLRAAANRGDLRAQALYYARARVLILPEVAAPIAETTMTAPIAEAMIAAGLLAAATAAASAASPPAPPSDWRSKPPATSWTR